MTIRVLSLTRYASKGASSRYRFFQYTPYLEGRGFVIENAALFSDAYLIRRYQSNRLHYGPLVKTYALRVAKLLTAGQYDLLWIEKEALPFIPAFLERLILRNHTPYVLDYDDAIYHTYDQHPSWIVRQLLGRKIARIMQGAFLVVAGNDYIADYARRAGAHRVAIIPTVIDLTRYDAIPHETGSSCTFGWIGTPVTARYLDIFRRILPQIGDEGKVRLLSIGSGPLAWHDERLEVVDWSQESEVEQLRRIDVGVMPLSDSPWDRGKCGLKLIQYMAFGLPVLASPVGVNVDIIEHGKNGFLCKTPEEWIDAMKYLADKPEVRAEMGKGSRNKVASTYSLEVAAPRLACLLTEAAGQASRSMTQDGTSSVASNGD